MNKLYRSRTDRMLFGVCGGLGKYLNVDPTIVRIIMVLLGISGVGILAYIVMVIIVPQEDSKKTTTQDIIEENAKDIKNTAEKLGTEIRNVFENKETKSQESENQISRRRNTLAIVLIAIGVIVLLSSVFSWPWGTLWAVALIVAGILLLVNMRRK